MNWIMGSMATGLEEKWATYMIEQQDLRRLFFLATSFLLGGWRTTLIAVSKTAFTFWNSRQRSSYVRWDEIIRCKPFIQSHGIHLLSLGTAFYISCCTNLFSQFLSLCSKVRMSRYSIRKWISNKAKKCIHTWADVMILDPIWSAR